MEAARCGKEGITINTFVLDPNPRLVAFAQEMTATNKGRMFLAGPYHLGEQVVLDYLSGRTVRHLHLHLTHPPLALPRMVRPPAGTSRSSDLQITRARDPWCPSPQPLAPHHSSSSPS